MSESDEEKTEDPTHKRLEEARKKGQVAYSKEVSNFFMIFAFSMLVIMAFPGIMAKVSNSMTRYFDLIATFRAEPSEFEAVGQMIVSDSLLALAIPLLLLVIAALASSLMQNGFNLSADPITPKLEKISLKKGWNRLFSRRSFIEFLKGIVKIIIIGVVAYYAVIDDLYILNQTQEAEMSQSIHVMKELCASILISVTIAIFFIAIFDFMFQKFEFMKQMKMSKHEVKEEYKQQEGDPKIKGKLKQIRMEKARKRMMAAVPTADVVITNPIHYAVALKYDMQGAQAPVVVAMGVDTAAEKIKEIADEHKIPIVRNPTLARALYAECDLEEEIPFDHYQAVAEIISYVYKLKKKS